MKILAAAFVMGFVSALTTCVCPGIVEIAAVPRPPFYRRLKSVLDEGDGAINLLGDSILLIAIGSGDRRFNSARPTA